MVPAAMEIIPAPALNPIDPPVPAAALAERAAAVDTVMRRAERTLIWIDPPLSPVAPAFAVVVPFIVMDPPPLLFSATVSDPPLPAPTPLALNAPTFKV